MLTLEWVLKKLLPCIIERRSLSQPKSNSTNNSTSPKNNNTGENSAMGSPQNSSTGCPIETHDKQREQEKVVSTTNNNNETSSSKDNNNDNNKDNKFMGKNPACVVPPHYFVVILDEAINVCLKHTKSKNQAVREVFCDPDISSCFPSSSETTTSENNNDENKNNDIQYSELQPNDKINSRPVIVIGPTRGHSVALANLIRNSILSSSSSSSVKQKRTATPETEKKSSPSSNNIIIPPLSSLPSFVFLGDYIDSGPCSLETLAIVLSLMVAYERLAMNQTNQNKTSSSTSSPSPSSGVSSPISVSLSRNNNNVFASNSNSCASSPHTHHLDNSNNNSPSFSQASQHSSQHQQHQNNNNMNNNNNNNSTPPPTVVLLRGRLESNFPAPVKWTGSTTTGYRRLDDELSFSFGSHLDNTSHSLVICLQKLRNIFSLLPCAAMVRCRLWEGEENSFLCIPGGPSPGLMRYSNFSGMKKAIEDAADRILRNPVLTALSTQNNQNDKKRRDSLDENSPSSSSSQQTTTTTTTKKTFSQRKSTTASVSESQIAAQKIQKHCDEQLLRDIASADPYEDEEDRAATTTGILFSDNPDPSRDQGMCCFSTEAAAMLLARSGANCLFRGNGWSLQKIAVHLSSSSSSPTSSPTSSTNISTSGRASHHTGRPKSSPYDPGYRMYRLPGHVKRAVQRGTMPHGSMIASPLAMSQSNSVTDLSDLGNLNTSSNNSSNDNNSPPASTSSSLNKIADNSVGSSNKSFPQLQNMMMNRGNNNNGKSNSNLFIGGKQNQKQQSNQSSLISLPQVVSLFSAPQFGNNFKSRNLGCVAVVQCTERLNDEKDKNKNKKKNKNNKNRNENENQHEEQDDDDDFEGMMLNDYESYRKSRSVLVSFSQFDDPKPLLFTPNANSFEEISSSSSLFQNKNNNHNNVDENKEEQEKEEETDKKDEEQEEEDKKIVYPVEKDFNILSEMTLDENDFGFLKRMKRLCRVLKTQSQLDFVLDQVRTHQSYHRKQQQQEEENNNNHNHSNSNSNDQNEPEVDEIVEVEKQIEEQQEEEKVQSVEETIIIEDDKNDSN